MILGELNKLFHGFCVDFTEKKVGFTENKYLVEVFITEGRKIAVYYLSLLGRLP